jgi:hypothetical protein
MARYERTWHGHYSVVFSAVSADQPTMHLYKRAVKVDDKWKDYSMCGRVMEYWLPFKHAALFGVECSQCERAAGRLEAVA